MLIYSIFILFLGIKRLFLHRDTVSGIVTSEEEGEPVVGASVLVAGTSLGAGTDIDGKFSIANVPSSAKTLQ